MSGYPLPVALPDRSAAKRERQADSKYSAFRHIIPFR
jgi:hypothetical protein